MRKKVRIAVTLVLLLCASESRVGSHGNGADQRRAAASLPPNSKRLRQWHSLSLNRHGDCTGERCHATRRAAGDTPSMCPIVDTTNKHAIRRWADTLNFSRPVRRHTKNTAPHNGRPGMLGNRT